MMRALIGVALSITVFLSAADYLNTQLLTAQATDVSEWDEQKYGPLPRWREGGTPPEDPRQPLHPYAVDLVELPREKSPPTSGIMASPPEYSPTDGVLFRYSTGAWPTVVTDCVVELTSDPSKDEKAYVVVANSSQQTSATNQFIAAGADMSKVEFIIQPTDSIWLRDYGPHFVWQSGAHAIADSHYYPSRPLDNFIPTLLAEAYWQIPSYHMGLYYSGGNFQPGPNRSAFITSLIYQDNPDLSGDNIGDLYNVFQGIDTLHIMPRLPGTVDGTGHIDMWMYLVDEDTVIISEFKPGSNPTAIEITNNAVIYMQDLGFEVYRAPAWNAGGSHYTYTNAFRVNDRILVPIYGPGNPSYNDEDQDALLAWQSAAGPSVEIIPINCYDIIWAAGAIHCIVMQVPRYTEAVPSAHVTSPDGNELLKSGTTHELSWVASDDIAVTSVDLFYSIDGGLTFPYLISSGEANDGSFDWVVPDNLSTQAKVQALAYDADSNFDEAVSEAVFEITDMPQAMYDFSSGAGVNKWCWGYQTSNWSIVDGNRYPVTNELSQSQYTKLAASDATGGDGDVNRYISPTPLSGYESTHVFEFTIDQDPAMILDIGILWEGYGDQCLQMELYVWDNAEGNWGDGAGLTGGNMYLANYAGNRDEKLVGHIRDSFERYVDSNGKLTILLYAERSSQETFHDYAAVTVTYLSGDPPLPDIKANGSDGPITITHSDTLILTVSLTAGSLLGYDADWWLVAMTPLGWYYYDRTSGWLPGREVTLQIPLRDLSTREVMNMSGLPVGNYTIYFGVDMVQNGLIDIGQAYYDLVSVTINP